MSEAIDYRWFSHRQIRYGTGKEKYRLYEELSEACTYALIPKALLFITYTNCFFSLFRSFDTACAPLLYLIHISSVNVLFWEFYP